MGNCNKSMLGPRISKYIWENTLENWKYVIETIYNDKELQKKISLNAKKLVNERFSVESFNTLMKKEVLYF